MDTQDLKIKAAEIVASRNYQSSQYNTLKEIKKLYEWFKFNDNELSNPDGPAVKLSDINNCCREHDQNVIVGCRTLDAGSGTGPC